jgi:hypothetical protein
LIVALLMASSGLAQGPLCELRGEGYRAAFRAEDGRLAQLTVAGRNILRSPVPVVLLDEQSGERRSLSGEPSDVQISARTAQWTQAEPGWRIGTRVEAGRDLEIELTLRNESPTLRAVTVLIDLAALPADVKPFVPAAHSQPPRHPARSLRFGYRSEATPIVFPAASLLSASAATGLTVSSPIDEHTQGFDIEFSAVGGPFVARRELRAEPGRDLRTVFRFSIHRPDPRSALRAIREHYLNAVRAHDPRAIEINGSFLWTPLAAPEQVRQWRAQGIRWVEVIFTAPFIGEFTPSKNPWSPTIDDLWMWEKLTPVAPSPTAGFAPIRAFLERRIPPWMTFDRVREFIRTLHKNDIRAFLYFQPSTAWSVYALDRFPRDVARDTAGDVIPDWLEQIAMNPRPGGEWARHLEEQFRGLLDSYPEADGIFMDQSHFDFPDYAHDDGVTLRGNRPAYRMGIAIREMTQRLVEMARSKGKMVWWNGPWMAEMGAPGDGHLSEASESIEALQYFGLGNKPITTGAAAIDSYDRVLLAGAQPAAPILSTIMLSHRYAKEVPASAAPPSEELALFEQYKPLFEAVRKREWLLEPNVVEVPEGFEANAFRNPDGDYVFPIVTSHAEPGTGWRFDVPVKIRLAEASQIRSALLVTPDCATGAAVKLQRTGKALRLTLARHRRASVIILSKTRERNAPAECPLPATEIGWLGSHRLYAGEAARLEVFVANHSPVARKLSLRAAASGVEVTGLPGNATLKPGERRAFPVTLKSSSPGVHTIRLTAGTESVDWMVRVGRFPMAEAAKLVSARIEFEGWIPDGSPDLRSASYADQFHVEGEVVPKPPPVAPREVRVDGQLAAFLPSLNDAKWRNLGPRLGDTRIPMQMKLPETILLRLDRTVRLTFRPSHPRDDFRLRKIALRLRFSDGSTASSEPLGEFRTMPPGSAGAAPIEVSLTLPTHFSRSIP